MLQFVLVRMQLQLGILLGFFVCLAAGVVFCGVVFQFCVVCVICLGFWVVGVFGFFCNKGGRNYFLHDILLCF